jgi:TolB-like protein/Flp pilus assembly protein TadD
MPTDSGNNVQSETRRLAAIMFTDIVGFSRQMGSDEARTLRLLTAHNQLVAQAVAAHHGTVIKTIGDAFLVDFPSVVHAVQCAQQIQSQFRAHNADKEPNEQIHLRIGIHSGDIVQRDGDVFGDGVNVASRLQTLAEPDTICISQVVYREVEKKLALGTVVSLGRPKLKNIVERFQVYALLSEPPKGVCQKLHVQRLKLSRRVRPMHWLSAAGLLLVVGILVTVHYFPLLLFLFFPPRLFAPNTEAALPSLPLPDKPSIVVLPFTNMSGDPSQDYFSDGITEDITTELSRFSSLFVISRNTAFFYKGKTVKLPELGRELGVQYVLEGSVRRAEGQVRVTIQLIEAAQDRHLWAERYERPLKGIFTVQDEIVQKIMTTLKLQLTLQEQGFLARRTTENLEAYDYYLRGLESYWRAMHETRKEANGRARQMYEKAIELDAHYAEAYAGLGMTYWLEWFFQWNKDRTQSLDRVIDLSQKAVALDDFLSLPHRILSTAYVWKRRHDEAIDEARRAIALAPNEAEGYENLGVILAFAGRPEEGIRLFEQAMRLNPRYPILYLMNLGFTYRMAGRYEEAIAPLKKVLALNPNFVPAHLNLAICYAELGRLAEAQAEVAECYRLNPGFSPEVFKQFLPYKNPADIERFLEGLRKAGVEMSAEQ